MQPLCPSSNSRSFMGLIFVGYEAPENGEMFITDLGKKEDHFLPALFIKYAKPQRSFVSIGLNELPSEAE